MLEQKIPFIICVYGTFEQDGSQPRYEFEQALISSHPTNETPTLSCTFQSCVTRLFFEMSCISVWFAFFWTLDGWLSEEVVVPVCFVCACYMCISEGVFVRECIICF